MQSATSFFNRALFRKNLQRFWPLWLGYVLIWLLLLPLPLLNELADYHGVPTVADTSYSLLQIGAYGGLVMGAVFGIFFAMAMFAYLTNPRATQGFHSMPVRRETLYATNYLTGLVCMVSALVLAFALAGITAACFGALDLTALGTALLAAVLSVLFFYSFGVFCMMFTGQILAAPVFYGILNVLAAGMEWLVRTFAGNFLYGYSGYSAPETFAFLSPAWELVCVLDVSNVARVDRILSDGTHQVIRGGEYMLSGLGVLGIYAAVGIVLAVLGLLVYRRRASEATGSIVTMAWARPIFKYGVAVCAAFSLGQTMTALLNCPEAALDRVLGKLADDKSNAYLTGGYYDVVSDGAYGEDDGELTAAQASTLVSALRRDYEAGRTANASLFEDTRYSGSFYVELELWYILRSDGKMVGTAMVTDHGEITKSSSPAASRSINVIVTPGMTCTLEALAGMGIETPTTARGF